MPSSPFADAQFSAGTYGLRADGTYGPQYYDAGMSLGAQYQEDAQNRIGQAALKQRQQYDQGYASKYGVGDVGAAVKGLTDTELYKMAVNLVNARRGTPASSASAGSSTNSRTGPSSGTTAPAVAPKVATTAPKVTAPTVKAVTAPKISPVLAAPAPLVKSGQTTRAF